VSTRDRLGALLGDTGSTVANPVDLAPTTTPDLFGQALATTLADPNVAAGLAIFAAPLAPFVEEMSSAIVAAAAEQPTKPVLACMMGQPVIIDRGGHAVPSFAFPESAVLALARVARYAAWRRRPEAVPSRPDDVDRDAARRLVDAALAAGAKGGWLDLATVDRLLGAYRISLVASEPAASRDEAVEGALRVGYPVAVKVVAPDPADRPGAGGVRLGLTGPAQVADAFDQVRTATGRLGDVVVVQAMAPAGVDLVVEASLDPLFGHLVGMGTGGAARSLRSDLEFRRAPLSELDAENLVRSARAAPLLDGEGGFAPADLLAVEDLLLRVGTFVEDVPEVAELSLDPVIASPRGATVAGAGIRLAPWRPRAEPALRRLR
jgi:acyl-CoA synthetase (NDP forming)